jgi:acetyltransferase
LLGKLIRTLREQGTQRIVATVLNENQRMLELARELGFRDDPARREAGTRAIVLDL